MHQCASGGRPGEYNLPTHQLGAFAHRHQANALSSRTLGQAHSVIFYFQFEAVRQETLRNRLEKGLRRTPGAIVFSDDVARLPNTSLFTVPGLRAETAVIGFDLAGIAVSSGSACSSGKVQPSHVLEAMGFRGELANGAVRLSLGWSTSEADIDRCLEAWRKLAGTLLSGERRNTA